MNFFMNFFNELFVFATNVLGELGELYVCLYTLAKFLA